jgi:hypothetical protein
MTTSRLVIFLLILGIGADGEDLRFTMEAPAGGSCSVSATYYTVES